MMGQAFQFESEERLVTLQQRSFVAAIVAGIVCVGLALWSPFSFWPTYLVAVLFVTGISLGCLGLAMLHQMTGGQWGFEIARNLVAGTTTLPLVALLFIPLMTGAKYVYPWLNANRASELLNKHQQVYFEPWFWEGRSIFYLLVWAALSWMVVHRYRSLSQTTEVDQWCATPRLSALGTLALSLTATFAMIDWVMSIDPKWMSTIFAAILMMGFVVSGMAFVLVMQRLPNSGANFPADAKSEHARGLDLGNLLMAFLLLWVYFTVSQFLIIWSGDLPVETSWYHSRLSGLWPGFGLLLVLFHFIIPFGSLLSRDVKTSPVAMAVVASGLLIMRVVDLVWTIIPSCRVDSSLWMVCLIASLIAVGGAWFYAFLAYRRPLPPLQLASVATVPSNSLEVIPS